MPVGRFLSESTRQPKRAGKSKPKYEAERKARTGKGTMDHPSNGATKIHPDLFCGRRRSVSIARSSQTVAAASRIVNNRNNVFIDTEKATPRTNPAQNIRRGVSFPPVRIQSNTSHAAHQKRSGRYSSNLKYRSGKDPAITAPHK